MRGYQLWRGSMLSMPRPRLARPRLPSTLPLLCYTQTRGKRTKTVLNLEDLPQGVLIPSPPKKAKSKEDEPQHEKQDDEKADEKADTTSYPTVILQARQNMHKFANCVLLTRVGGFYELYFEHAADYAPLLNIKLASKKTNAGPVPMAGFPFFQLDRFLKILVHDHSRYVAIAEEFPNSAADKIKGGLMHDRRVARIVTPGTLIDENFIDPYTNNYVLAIQAEADSETSEIGLAWLDLSTGHFYTQPATLPALGSILSRIAPREIVLDERLTSSDEGSDTKESLAAVLSEERQQLVTYTALPPGPHSVADWRSALESDIAADAASEFTPREVAAGSLLLHYVRDRLQPQGSGQTIKLQPPIRYGLGAGADASGAAAVMTIDKNSMRSLEIKQTLRDGMFKGSLLHAIRRTVTKSGARLLNEWLSAPSASLETIEQRQDLVAHFIADEDLRDGVTTLLKRSYDSHRLVQKFALGRGDPDDLLDLAKTIAATDDIVALLKYSESQHSDKDKETACLSAIAARIELDRPRAVAERIRASVDEEGLMHQHELEDSEADAMMSLAEEVVQAEGESLKKTKSITSAPTQRRPKLSFRDYYGEDNEAWVMKPDASAPLKKLHARLADLARDRAALTDELRARLGAPSLVLKWTPGLGHICHVKGKDARAAAASANAETTTTLSSSRTTRSMHVPEWTALGQRLDQVRLHIRGEEQRVFAALREAVVRSLVPLRRNAAVLDELDIATSFARLALEQNLNRPRLNTGTATAIVGGRHPTVEGGLAEQGRSFTRNDLFLGSSDATAENTNGKNGQVWLVTGPNMAGKSTFLRQNALITILAQVGCYVPADYAELGLVDALFSRVGSADNLFRDQSTFMVEMLETAHILKEATPRSFVIMDEIGRGTTPEDGTAVGYAALHHLVHVNKCRALFATHFHGIAELAAADGLTSLSDDEQKESHPIELYCTDVEEDEDGQGFVYVHRLRRGINRQSHALKVARLAGLPDAAVQVAQKVLRSTTTIL